MIHIIVFKVCGETGNSLKPSGVAVWGFMPLSAGRDLYGAMTWRTASLSAAAVSDTVTVTASGSFCKSDRNKSKTVCRESATRPGCHMRRATHPGQKRVGGADRRRMWRTLYDTILLRL